MRAQSGKDVRTCRRTGRETIGGRKSRCVSGPQFYSIYSGLTSFREADFPRELHRRCAGRKWAATCRRRKTVMISYYNMVP